MEKPAQNRLKMPDADKHRVLIKGAPALLEIGYDAEQDAIDKGYVLNKEMTVGTRKVYERPLEDHKEAVQESADISTQRISAENYKKAQGNIVGGRETSSVELVDLDLD